MIEDLTPDTARPNELWLVVVENRAYTDTKLEYNIVSARSPEFAVQHCVDKEHALHLITMLTDEVMASVFNNVACCITPLEA